MKTRRHLSDQERDQIAIWRAQETSIREIARRLGRHHSSIEAELRRNRWGETYVAIHAKIETRKRSQTARRRHPLKDSAIYAYVLERLRWGWSPEEISGRLRLERGEKVLHHESIYRFIYAQKNKSLNLWEYLPRKQKKRREQTGRSRHKSRIPNRVSIHQRPEEVEEREVFGHWEGDSVVGLGKKEGIHTEVERKTRFLLAKKVEKIGAVETAKAQIQLFEKLPKGARKTTTVDNGKEFTKHEQVTNQMGLKVYFADPYSSWQRGTNENTNGRLRRYLPKKTSFKELNPTELDEIVEEINNHPRKCLQYRKPVEVFNQELTTTGGFPFRM